jgi:hypothetical protein
MPQRLTRFLIPALLAAFFLTPALAAARPQRDDTERPAAAPALLAELRSLLTALWAEGGSILEPNGDATTNSTTTGDTGSGLEPDGRH